MLLTVILLKKSAELLVAVSGGSEPIPPSKSSWCCGVEPTGMTGTADGVAWALAASTDGSEAALVFSPLNKEGPVLAGAVT